MKEKGGLGGDGMRRVGGHPQAISRAERMAPSFQSELGGAGQYLDPQWAGRGVLIQTLTGPHGDSHDAERGRIEQGLADDPWAWVGSLGEFEHR